MFVLRKSENFGEVLRSMIFCKSLKHYLWTPRPNKHEKRLKRETLPLDPQNKEVVIHGNYGLASIEDSIYFLGGVRWYLAWWPTVFDSHWHRQLRSGQAQIKQLSTVQ